MATPKGRCSRVLLSAQALVLTFPGHPARLRSRPVRAGGLGWRLRARCAPRLTHCPRRTTFSRVSGQRGRQGLRLPVCVCLPSLLSSRKGAGLALRGHRGTGAPGAAGPASPPASSLRGPCAPERLCWIRSQGCAGRAALSGTSTCSCADSHTHACTHTHTHAVTRSHTLTQAPTLMLTRTGTLTHTLQAPQKVRLLL